MPHVTRPDTRVRRTLALAALAAALVACQGDASAQTLTKDARSDFRRFDITEGGWLSGTELDACGCRRYDTDNDGEVTLVEYEAGRVREANSKAAPAPRRPAPPPVRTAAADFARIDVNEDGWLSGTELTACGCIALDKDKDGEVTRAEYLAGAATAKPKRRNAAKDADPPAKHAPVEPARPSAPTPTPSPAPAPKPAAPTPTPPPTPAPVTAAGPPVGLWSCYNYQPYVGFGTYWGQVRLDAGGTYEHVGVGRGEYNRTNGTIAFRSGDLAPIYDVKYPTGSGNPQFDLIGKGDMQGIFVRCSATR